MRRNIAEFDQHVLTYIIRNYNKPATYVLTVDEYFFPKFIWKKRFNHQRTRTIDS